MATGLNLAPTTQVASHCDSCGQTRPHTAGSALVLFRIWYDRLMSLLLQRGDEAGDIDAHRAARNAARLLAAQAALGFVQRAFEIQPQRHFVEVVDALFGRLVRHGRALRRNGLDVLGQARTGRRRQRRRAARRSERGRAVPHRRCAASRLASLADSSRNRSRAAFSSRSKRFWRSDSSSKFTRWPSKSAPSTQANFILPPTVTRHDPHMPVPSTMMEFRLTMVGMPNGRVTSAAGLHHGNAARWPPLRSRPFRRPARRPARA